MSAMEVGGCAIARLVDWQNAGDTNATCARASSGHALFVAVARGSGYGGI